MLIVLITGFEFLNHYTQALPLGTFGRNQQIPSGQRYVGKVFINGLRQPAIVETENARIRTGEKDWGVGGDEKLRLPVFHQVFL